MTADANDLIRRALTDRAGDGAWREEPVNVDDGRTQQWLTTGTARVIDGIARVGDRVRHAGQRYAEAYSLGTATITGFNETKVLLAHDDPAGGYARDWDYDRTVLLDQADVAETRALRNAARASSGLPPE